MSPPRPESASRSGRRDLAALRRAQRSDRAAAAALAVLAGGVLAWMTRNGLHSWPAATVAGVLGTAALYVLLTRRLRADLALARQPIPDWWQGALEEALPYFGGLPAERRLRFLRRVQVFLSDQRITGIGCEPDDTDRLLVAAAAIMLVEGFPRFRYPSTREILVYPTAFDADSYVHDDEGDQVGQVLHAGPVILSLPELRRGFTDEDWSNVAVHEMSHVLDQIWSPVPGEFASDYDEELAELMDDRRLVRKIRRGRSAIDDYALEDAQEFFAVCTEVLFEDPHLLEEEHPRVYRWLARLYRQDPVRELGEPWRAVEAADS